ncbi:hypothetical protein [Hyunsoonleella ulvae]|uniref:hypothetical protein n=1 Tax=Hyunsoonleella ulvae TaxID=2799948 RepID=UPI00193A8F31|nr:hypothetical protein [Hyunsoonleella ulvae]
MIKIYHNTLKLFITLLFCPFVSYSQNDSINVDKLYNLAVRNSDTKPKIAKDYLYKTVTYIDSVLDVKPRLSKFFINKKATSLHFLSYFERRENNYDIALKHMLESIKIKESLENYEELPVSFHQLGILWMYQEEYSKAKTNLDSALTLSKKYNVTRERLGVLSTMGNLYLNSRDTLGAEQYHLRAIKLADSINSPYDIAAVNANYAQYLRQSRRMKENLPFLKKSIEYHKNNSNKIGMESGYAALATTYRNLDNPKLALKYMQVALKLSEELGNEALLPYRYKTIQFAYAQLGNYEKAYENHVKYLKLLEKRYNDETFKRMADLDAKHKYEKQKSIDSLKLVKHQEIETERLKYESNRRLWIVAVSLLALIILLSIGYMVHRNKSIKAEQLALKRQFENQKLQEDVNVKQKEIVSLISETIDHINTKSNLVEELKKLKSGYSTQDLQSIIADLKSKTVEENKSLLLKNYIESENQEFINLLKRSHPNLTKTDIEICTLIRLGLSRKEIAALRNTSIEAIKSSKFRLKRKMNVSKDIVLDDYINNL